MASSDAPLHRRAGTPADDALSMRHMAHELNSLLDGSLRSVGLAARLLHAADGAATAEIVSRLRTAQDAMWEMAELLERVMAGDRGTRILGTPRPLGDEIDRLAALLEPLAAAHGVEIVVRVTPEAGALPAGALGAVAANGLRNAIQACSRQGGAAHRVELDAEVRAQAVIISISDTGPGLDPHAGPEPGGHGLGLGICRRVVESVGGSLVLETAPWGWGTRLRAEIPLRRVTAA